MPKGTIKIKFAILMRITWAAKDSTLMRPAKIAKISKHHHSKQSASADGTLIVK